MSTKSITAADDAAESSVARAKAAGEMIAAALVGLLEQGGALFNRYEAWRSREAAAEELMGMSDRELRDIGLSRGEVRSAVSGGCADPVPAIANDGGMAPLAANRNRPRLVA
jgi:uncharacterized protein YjiS (DUF1127 family)